MTNHPSLRQLENNDKLGLNKSAAAHETRIEVDNKTDVDFIDDILVKSKLTVHSRLSSNHSEYPKHRQVYALLNECCIFLSLYLIYLKI